MSTISFFSQTAAILGFGTRDGQSEWQVPKSTDVIVRDVAALKENIKDKLFDSAKVDALDTNQDQRLSRSELETAKDEDLVELYNALVSPDGRTWQGSPYASNILICIEPNFRNQLLQEPAPQPSNEPLKSAKMQ